MTGTVPQVGDRLVLAVGAVAHGGHCVARHDGLVVFVRHALPGERVLAEVTEVRRAHLRAEAVQVLVASPDRVTPVCPYARPGGCGGCDLQHVALPAQRRWKETVIREQLVRLGRLTEDAVDALAIGVRPLPGDGTGWRTRVRFAVDAAGRAGLRAHHSHRVVGVDRCRIAAPAVQREGVTGAVWPHADEVAVVASAGGDVCVQQVRDGRREPVRGPGRVREWALGRQWSLPPEVFWQVHPDAPDALAGAVLALLDPRPGERAWDLYGGAGLFAAALALRGAATVSLVESSAVAAQAARENLTDLPAVRVRRARVDAALRQRRLPPPEVVVLDPPRAGAGAAVVRGIVRAAPRAVAYVACDPAAFARDVAVFGRHGWTLAALRSFDCFPQTHHVESVGLLRPGR